MLKMLHARSGRVCGYYRFLARRALSVFAQSVENPPRDLSKQELAFDAWIHAKRTSGEVWIHPDVTVGRVAGGGYGLFAQRDIPIATTELVRVTLPRFSAAVAEHSCYAGNPEFYSSIKQLVLTSIAPKAALVQQQNLVGSICLALRNLVLSNSEADADLRPYYDLIKANSYPYNAAALPHPLCLDHEYESALAQSKASGSHLRDFDLGLDPTGAQMVSLLGWLEGTPLHRALHVRKRLYNLVAKGLFRGNDMHKTNFDYAMGVILSRAMSGAMPSHNSPQPRVPAHTHAPGASSGQCEVPLTLVPLIDFANHAAKPSAFVSYNGQTHEFLLKPAPRDPEKGTNSDIGNCISAGAELTISYGEERDSVSFLSLYGFCPRASKYNGFLFSFNIADNLGMRLTLPPRMIVTCAEDLRHEKDTVPDVRLNIPLVALFSQDVERMQDTRLSAQEKLELFERTLGRYIAPYYSAAQEASRQLGVHTNPSRSVNSSGSSNLGREGVHLSHTADLIQLLQQEIKQLQNTRFHSRDKGEYLCKSVAEEKFVEDCLYYIETQEQSAKVLVQAVAGYCDAVETVLKESAPSTP